MTLFLYRLGRAAVRRRRFVVGAWVLIAIATVWASATVGGETSDTFDVPGVEAQKAIDVLEERFPSAAGTSAQLVFAVDPGTLSDPTAAAAVEAALIEVAAQPDVGSVGELQRSADGRIGYADVQYSQPSSEIRDEAFQRLEATADAANASGAVQMELGGDLPSDAANTAPMGQELIGLVAAVIVLLLAFGSVIAMGLPIGTALLGLATSIGLIALIAAVVDVSSIAPTLATMIGLGVGIDYALFIVTRHRENLKLGMTVEEAAGRAIATSGSAVLFAGMTVVIALSGLAIAGIPLVTVMGLMSGLTVAVMVAIFQWGWLKGLFGVDETVPIISFLPMMMFAILFGLSMDYEVFLLSRMREEYLNRGNNDDAVIEGLAATARVITSAAIIMISVFAAFVLGDDVTIKMFGLGLAAAVFIDATIVRMVLVPATMKLLGDRNWWLPTWLDRILPNVEVEGGTGLPTPEYEPDRAPAPSPREPAIVN